MLKWRIRTRLTISFLALIVMTLSLLGSYILWYFYQHNIAILKTNLLTNAQITEQLLRNNLDGSLSPTNIDTKVKNASLETNLRITVIDKSGLVTADSWENPALMENHLERPEVALALAGQNGHSIRYSNTLGQNMLYVAVPVRQNDNTLGVVRVASTLSQVEAGFNELKSALLAAILITSLLSIALAIHLARKFTAPLEQITDVARQIADGRFDKRLHIHSGDEIELLAHTLNNLTSALEDKINETVAEANKLALILRHMDNAVILLDRYGRVTTANKMARDIFDLTDTMLGRHNIHVIGNSLFDRAIHETIAQEKSRMIDLKTNIHGQKRVFQAFLAPVTAAENDITGVLGVFHDITALQEIHERQAEFVANASHELATPLTSIKGFAETLLDGALQDTELSVKFVTIIHTEAERMHRLVKELLQLAKLDSEEYRRQIKMQPTPVQPLLERVSLELAPQAGQKNITLSVKGQCDCLEILANYDWIKQVLVNLTENGIKYTPNGGSITLQCCRDNNHAVILISDTGIGILPKDLPLIFDRFYRVDRARSRSAGSTGLGLAIVKFIVEMHGGIIDVVSELNKGTTFTIRLPLLPDDPSAISRGQ